MLNKCELLNKLALHAMSLSESLLEALGVATFFLSNFSFSEKISA